MTLVTHSSPGGGSDVFLREMVPHLSRIMGVTFVVDNLQGGSGARAMATLARAKPDGGMFYATTPTFIYTSLLSTPSASYNDLEPLVNIFYDPEVLYTAADSPFKTLQDVLDRARKGGGKWGAANPASLERQVMERLKQKAGVTPAVATFEGGGDLLINVLNHTLDMGVGELQEITAQLDARKIRLLAVVGDARLARFPEVKTVKEQGIDLSVRKFRGLAGPKGTPPDVIAAWEAAIPNASRRSRIQEDLYGERPAAWLHSARRVRQVHRRLRQGDGSLPQGIRRDPVMNRDLVLASVAFALALALLRDGRRHPAEPPGRRRWSRGSAEDLRRSPCRAVAHPRYQVVSDPYARSALYSADPASAGSRRSHWPPHRTAEAVARRGPARDWRCVRRRRPVARLYAFAGRADHGHDVLPGRRVEPRGRPRRAVRCDRVLAAVRPAARHPAASGILAVPVLTVVRDVLTVVIDALISLFTTPIGPAAFGGVAWGILGGALPGISPSITMALLLPFTYGMDPTVAVVLLASTYVGAEYGGSIPAILIRTPGTNAAAATVVDGYAMKQQGKAGEALGISLYSGFVGGLFGLVVLVLLTERLSSVALAFTPTAYFALGVLGLSVIASLSGESLVKGLIAGVLGLMIATVGTDPVTGVNRFTFDSPELLSGIPPILVMVGLFAISELFVQSGEPGWEKAAESRRGSVFPTARCGGASRCRR